MKYEIKHIDSSVLAIVDIDCANDTPAAQQLGLAVQAAIRNGISLQHADLQYADLHCADLHCAKLQYADLQYADLQHADLRYADLRYADLHCAKLQHADLQYADLQHADLWDAKDAPIQIIGLKYSITVHANRVHIGCKTFTKQEFREIKDDNCQVVYHDLNDEFKCYHQIICNIMDTMPVVED